EPEFERYFVSIKCLEVRMEGGAVPKGVRSIGSPATCPSHPSSVLNLSRAVSAQLPSLQPHTGCWPPRGISGMAFEGTLLRRIKIASGSAKVHGDSSLSRELLTLGGFPRCKSIGVREDVCGGQPS